MFKPKEETQESYEEYEEEISQSESKKDQKIYNEKPLDKTAVKNLLKAKLQKKVDENESKKILTLHFSNEKPTFDINILDESENPD
ncbi:MAG: hypothetical protein ACOZBL_00340 [Patescibacteria group bacterium]